LKDSHAETLARRGLIAVFWNEVEKTLEGIKEKLDAKTRQSNTFNRCEKFLEDINMERNCLQNILEFVPESLQVDPEGVRFRFENKCYFAHVHK